MGIIPFERGRSRERGKSARSWLKHDFAEKIAASQVHAYRVNRADHSVLLIDGNAGDGDGVPVNSGQPDLFIGDVLSRPTPEILTRVAAQVGNAKVVLCEKKYQKRAKLLKRFPEATVLAHQREAPFVVRDEHRYALWLSDPCGYRDHGVEHMRAVAARVRTDFVIILNEGALKRLEGTSDSDWHWETSRELYLDRLDPQWWREELRKRYLARSHVIPISQGFRCRFMVVADYLADACYRHPFEEIYTAAGVGPADKKMVGKN